MPRNLKTVVAAAALIGGLLAAPALYAQGTGGMMGGMMQGRQRDMMGQGGMMEGMMGMMSQMSAMMKDCNEMMQGMDDHGAQRPNEQWQERQPEQPQPEGNAG
jgi:hypothetical protein